MTINESSALTAAISALQRISRTTNHQHTQTDVHKLCRCAKCEALTALEDIRMMFLSTERGQAA